MAAVPHACHGITLSPSAPISVPRSSTGVSLVTVAAPARQIATRVLHRVMHDDAWATPTLDAELRRSTASRVDAALATQIVYGTLRAASDLDGALARHARRPVKVDDWTHAALLGAAYQLLHLDRVPSHAVVNDAVELVRMKRGKRMAGFVNAILRKVAVERPEGPEPSSAVAVPSWLRDALRNSIGAQHAEDLLRLGHDHPAIDLRVRVDVERGTVAETIRAARPDATVSPTALSPHGLRIAGAGDPRLLPGYGEGLFAVQEEGAQSIGLLLETQPGERVLDACAGRGGKTAQLIEAVGEAGHVVASRSARAPSRADPRRAHAAPVGLRAAARVPASIGRWAKEASRATSIGCSSTLRAPDSGPCAVGLKFYCVPGTEMRPAWVRYSAACSRTWPPWSGRVEPSSTRSALHCVKRAPRSSSGSISPDLIFKLRVLLA